MRVLRQQVSEGAFGTVLRGELTWVLGMWVPPLPILHKTVLNDRLAFLFTRGRTNPLL